MNYDFDEAKLKLGLLREKTEGEPCDVEAKRDEWEEEPVYALHLLTPTYELTPGIIQALHQVGPFAVRHLGQVRDNDSRHVWLLKPENS